jgi:hypothetical protein
MSLLRKKLNKTSSTSSINWDPSEGWHEARIVGVADVGEVPNKFQNGKLQPKVSIMFAFDEFVETEKGKSQKTKIERYTASFHEKSGLVKNILSPAEITAESLDELIGKTLRLKLKQEGNYLNIVNADISEKALSKCEDVYVPKFWLVDKEGGETGFDIIVEDGVINDLRPVTETETSKPKNTSSNENEDEDEDLYN